PIVTFNACEPSGLPIGTCPRFSVCSQVPQPFLLSGDRSVEGSSAIRAGGVAAPEPSDHHHVVPRKETFIVKFSRSWRAAITGAAVLIAILASTTGKAVLPVQARSSSIDHASKAG